MRMLTDAEMDAIFGGDGNYTQTLDTVTVTGSRVTGSGGYYMPGLSGFLKEETSGGCSWCYAYYQSMFRSIPADQVPTKERVTCVANATALPGKGFKPSYTLHVLPQRVFRNPSLSNGQTSWIHRGGQGNSTSGVPGYTAQVGGLTISASNGKGVTYVYAGGMVPGSIMPGYIDPLTNQPGTLTGELTRAEHLAYVIAHETYHQHHAFTEANTDENRANGWGVHAVKRMREGAAAHCPAS
ncbi:hypothetical protein [Noviluteimonas gilva]|uniref:Uncharacterized protein n=1 Tax=Noviluteimonas gilva TaxID=2682097 RepID=A0A7C9HV14_9GAMM|nr:hypothetical protein [Lysobacter gilvus]MUV15351.1 hypothetical protein [Lysobacter gilvus]